MARLYFDASLEDLASLVKDHRAIAAVLGPIWEELTFRNTDGARQLRREVQHY
jgi:hypothetical protein